MLITTLVLVVFSAIRLISANCLPDEYCELDDVGFCHDWAVRGSNAHSDFRYCLLSRNGFDRIIECIGDGTGSQCIVDDTEDVMVNLSPYELLIDAAETAQSAASCRILNELKECPDTSSKSFRYCLCQRGVKTCHFECLSNAHYLDLSPWEPKFTDGCPLPDRDERVSYRNLSQSLHSVMPCR
jgi:hypothetical protein